MLLRLQALRIMVAGVCVLLEQACLVEEVDVLGPLLDVLEALANGCLQRLEQPLVEEGVEEVAARQLRLAARLRSQPLLRGREGGVRWAADKRPDATRGVAASSS